MSDWLKTGFSVTRRSFLKASAAVAGAAAVEHLMDGKPVLRALAAVAESSASQQNAASGERLVDSICRPNCWESCRVYAHVRDGRVVKTSLAPMPDERYNRICLRGLTHMQRIYSPDRIKYPMRRVGARGEDQWERISWDDAIDQVVTEFNRIREDYGDKAISFCAISGNYGSLSGIASRLKNVIGGTNLGPSLDMALPVGMSRVVGGFPFLHANEPADLANARTLIVWGSNVTESQIHNWHFMADAIENGCKLIVIDPMFTTTAAKADMFVPLRPGSDPAFALSMMQVIIEEDLLNKPFMREHTVAPFLVRSDTKQFLRDSDLTGEPVEEGEDDPFIVWDSESDEPGLLSEVAMPALEGTFDINGISVTTAFSLLKDLANDFTPEESQRLTNVRPEVTREVARLYATRTPASIYPGYGCDHYDNGHLHAHAIATLAGLTGNLGAPGAQVGQFIPFGPVLNWVGFLFPDWKMGGGEVSVLNLREVLETGEYMGEPYPIKAMYVYNANPVSNHNDQREWLDHILPALDFIVVAEMAMTDTVRYADLVLPVAHWFEVEEIVMAGNHPFAMIQDKAVEPLFETKSDTEICRLLAPGLGVGEYFTHSDTELIDILLDTDAARAINITPERLREEKVLRFLPDPFIFGEGGNVPTPTRRVEFYVENPQPREYYGQEIDADAERLPYFRPPIEAWPENPLFDRYPLVCIQEHTRWRVHAQWFETPWLRELDPEPTIKLSREDADARNIKTGDVVEAFNDRGRVVLKAIVTDGLPAGVVNIPKGWQRHQNIEGGYQELTASHLNPVTVNQSYFDVLVEVRKV